MELMREYQKGLVGVSDSSDEGLIDSKSDSVKDGDDEGFS